MSPGFNDAHWQTLATGPWNLQTDALKNYRGIGLYRAVIRIPAGWSGHRIVLGLYTFDTPIVYDSGEFYINGKPVTTYKARGWNQSLKYDVTDLLKPGANILAVKVTGGQIFSGVSGAVWFEPEKLMDTTLDLGGRWQLIKTSIGATPTDVQLPGTPNVRYLQNDFTVPADWSGRAVYLHIDMPDQWLGSIVVNGHPNSYNDFLHPFPLRTEINVTPFLLTGKLNHLELWPFQSISTQGRPAPTVDQHMTISAIRIGTVR
jgi:hypothetical protein